jgi:hypothetical protein
MISKDLLNTLDFNIAGLRHVGQKRMSKLSFSSELLANLYVLLMFKQEAVSNIFLNSFANIVLHLTLPPEYHHMKPWTKESSRHDIT